MENEVKFAKHMALIGRLGSLLSIAMYVSYVPQIMNNLAGAKGNPLQPLVAAINSALWCAYALMHKKTDWPILIANAPGIVFGLVAFLTAI
ncbi:SemiSWEET family transporter [Lacticaseibacillus sp. GG6-2]